MHNPAILFSSSFLALPLEDPSMTIISFLTMPSGSGRFTFLSLYFGLFTFRDVHSDGLKFGHIPLRVKKYPVDPVLPAQLSARPDDFVLIVDDRLSGGKRGQMLSDIFLLMFWNEVKESLTDQFIFRPVEITAVQSVDKGDGGVPT
ncbi:MAG: hypothetical protein PHP23_01035 [Desulfobacterales bacterium]|nr:hypothetical protein [Desulfobacterales bacterium]